MESVNRNLHFDVVKMWEVVKGRSEGRNAFLSHDRGDLTLHFE